MLQWRMLIHMNQSESRSKRNWSVNTEGQFSPLKKYDGWMKMNLSTEIVFQATQIISLRYMHHVHFFRSTVFPALQFLVPDWCDKNHNRWQPSRSIASSTPSFPLLVQFIHGRKMNIAVFKIFTGTDYWGQETKTLRAICRRQRCKLLLHARGLPDVPDVLDVLWFWSLT